MSTNQENKQSETASPQEVSGSPKGGPEWAPKREWWLHGPEFLVVVKHHIVKSDPDRGGDNRWNVYAYIYPKHWHFAAFNGESLFQAAATDLPLHSGPSYCREHRDANGVTSYQVGSDYDHNWDGYFRGTTPEEHFPDGKVFLDALELFNWLAARREA